MSHADVLWVANIVSVLLGAVVMPHVVALVINCKLANGTKRIVAMVISILFSLAIWYLSGVVNGDFGWQGLATTAPVLWTSATIAYNKYWKGKIGAIEEFDLISGLFFPDEDPK